MPPPSPRAAWTSASSACLLPWPLGDDNYCRKVEGDTKASHCPKDCPSAPGPAGSRGSRHCKLEERGRQHLECEVTESPPPRQCPMTSALGTPCSLPGPPFAICETGKMTVRWPSGLGQAELSVLQPRRDHQVNGSSEQTVGLWTLHLFASSSRARFGSPDGSGRPGLEA